MICRSPAKLNLFLHIEGKRKDGYHNLKSVFQLLDLCDTISFTPAKKLELSVQQKNNQQKKVPNDDSNLVLRAALDLASYSKCGLGASIHLEKNIPSGAGLGGGSSNAAVTLLALNKLWNLGLTIEALSQIGADIGADIPFFLAGKNAFVEGKGERVNPIFIRPTYYILCLSDVFCSTSKIFSCYGDCNQQLTTEYEWVGLPAPDHVNGFSAPDLMALGNHLMPVVFNLYPQLELVYQSLSSVCRVTMSGSGSSFFALADSEQEAALIVQDFQRVQAGLQYVVIRGISQYDYSSVGV